MSTGGRKVRRERVGSPPCCSAGLLGSGWSCCGPGSFLIPLLCFGFAMAHSSPSGVTLTLGSPSAIAGVLAVVVVRLGKGGISRSVRDRQTCFSSSRHLRARGIETESFVSAGPLAPGLRIVFAGRLPGGCQLQ